MRTLNVSVSRDLLEQIQNLEHEQASLQRQEQELAKLMSGEEVEVSSEAAKKAFKGAILIGKARRGGLQSQLAVLRQTYDHECVFDQNPKSATFNQRICHQHPETKHRDGWPAEGPTAAQREEAWTARWPLEEQVARLNRELERVRKRLSVVADGLLGLRRRFGDEALKVGLMSLSVAAS